MTALLTDVRETQRLIEERLARAVAARPNADGGHVRDQYPPIDTFLATASRHVAATVQVLVPAVRKRLPDGSQRAKAYLAQTRRFSQTLAQVKAKLYGSVYGVGSWPQLWRAVEREYAALAEMEIHLAELLEDHPGAVDEDLVTRLHRAELRAPTRPHPFIPQRGASGGLARALARRIDAFWDAAEGRMVPGVERHHERAKQGLITQYFLGDPHVEDWADEEAEKPPRDRR